MRNFIATVAVMLGMGLGTLPSAAEEPPVVWRMSAYVGETTELWKNIVVPFTTRVNQLSAGRLRIEPYPVDVLTPATRNYEAVLDGTADAAMVTPLYAVNKDPANTFFAGHPGGMGPETMLSWLYEGGGQDLLTEFKRETIGLHSLVGGVVGTELWHSHVSILTPADLKGVKFRAAGGWASILNEEFSAAPVFVNGAEVYQMLERRGVDIAEWSGPADNKIAGLQDAAEYILTPGLHFPAGINEFIIKKETWDALPTDLQQIVTAAAKLAVFESYLQSGKNDMDAMEVLRSGKNKVEELPKEVTDAITAAGRNWATRTADQQSAAGNDWMKKIGESYFGFQNHYAASASYKHIDRN